MTATSFVAKPVGRSPIYRWSMRHGAHFLERAGWLVVDQFGDAGREALSVRASVGLCDLSFAGKLEFQGADAATGVQRGLGILIAEPGRIVLWEDGYACRLSRDQVLLVSETVNLTGLAKSLRELGTGCFHLVDRTSGFGQLLLCGPQARSVLRRATAIDVRDSTFPDLRCAWAPMAGVRVLVVRRDRRDLPAYEILVSRESAEYLCQFLIEAGRNDAISPFGLQALRQLESA
jgi:methylglutamate dehydrogenase subunit C